MKTATVAPSSASKRPSGGLAADSVQLGWTILTSGWTLLVVGGLLAAVYLAGAHVWPTGASFKELLDTHSFAASRTMFGLGLNDPAAGWVALFLYLIGCLNVLGLFLRYGLRGGGEPRTADTAPDSDATDPVTDAPTVNPEPAALDEPPGVWTSVASATVANTALHQVVQKLPDSYARTRRGPGGDTVTAQRGLWEGGWILLAAGALTLLGSIAIDRGGAFEGRVSMVPGTSQPTETEFRADSGMWIKRPGLRILCLPADPNDTTRTRKCRVPPPGGGEPVEVVLAAGLEANVDGMRLRQVRELSMPALVNEGAGPSLLIRAGAADGPPQKLDVQANGTTYRVTGKGSDGQDQQVQVTSFFGPDGPFVVASTPGKPPTLLTPALGRPPAPVPGTTTFVSGIPWWSVELRASTDPGLYLRLTGAGLLLLGLLLMLAVPDIRLEIAQLGDGCRLRVKSANRPNAAKRELAELLRLTEKPASGPTSDKGDA